MSTQFSNLNQVQKNLLVSLLNRDTWRSILNTNEMPMTNNEILLKISREKPYLTTEDIFRVAKNFGKDLTEIMKRHGISCTGIHSSSSTGLDGWSASSSGAYGSSRIPPSTSYATSSSSSSSMACTPTVYLIENELHEGITKDDIANVLIGQKPSTTSANVPEKQLALIFEMTKTEIPTGKTINKSDLDAFTGKIFDATIQPFLLSYIAANYDTTFRAFLRTKPIVTENELRTSYMLMTNGQSFEDCLGGKFDVFCRKNQETILEYGERNGMPQLQVLLQRSTLDGVRTLFENDVAKFLSFLKEKKIKTNCMPSWDEFQASLKPKTVITMVDVYEEPKVFNLDSSPEQLADELVKQKALSADLKAAFIEVCENEGVETVKDIHEELEDSDLHGFFESLIPKKLKRGKLIRNIREIIENLVNPPTGVRSESDDSEEDVQVVDLKKTPKKTSPKKKSRSPVRRSSRSKESSSSDEMDTD